MHGGLTAKFFIGATMTLAGFLLFLVQPMLAKFILPWFGGSATTWTVCMLFFQLALLVGYAWAYAVTSPLTLRTQAIAQLVLLAIGIAMLPITPSEALKPVDAENPVGRIMLLLIVCVSAPYAILATTSPLLQRWLHQLYPQGLTSRFFALSNLGSFVGLLSYPFFFEPIVASTAQTRVWSIGFVLYALCFAACAVMMLRSPKAALETDVAFADAARGATQDSISGWILWSMLGSILLLATTNQINQWSAVMPFLWVLPLSLYLLTFIIAFGHQQFYRRAVFFTIFAVLAGVTFIMARPTSSNELLTQVGLQCATMFTGCMICHAEMVKLQPPARRLPIFYLLTSVGGALGGILVTLAAPLVFNDYWEHQIVLVVIAGLAAWMLFRNENAGIARIAALVGLAAFSLGLGAQIYDTWENRTNVVERIRNFYGVVKVLKEDEDDPDEYSLVMQQAGVDQGSQFQKAERRMEPACAFGVTSGIGHALAGHKKRRDGGPAAPLNIGIIGLGVGMIAGHGVAGDNIRYYELNPAVTDLARRHFTFLSSSKAKTEVVHGDGRILLERESIAGQKKNFDILIIDAFRGASPPMHLMTREAFAVYLDHLAPDGILAINFELDTFEMSPLHRGLAGEFNLGVNWFETPPAENCDNPVSWALYTKDPGLWNAPHVSAAISPWRDRAATKMLWTDSSSNLLSIINWRSFF